MSFKAWFKSKTADKVLGPVRSCVIDLIDENSSVLEIGCGTGDLLIRASSKIERGLGLDLDHGMISFARKRAKIEKIDNLDFIGKDISSVSPSSLCNFNVSTSALCLHEMNEEDAISSLTRLGNCTSKIIIADYAEPHSGWGKISIEMDEMISGHYGNFRAYRSKGRIPYLAQKAGLGIVSEIETPIDGILIWVLKEEKTGSESNCF